MCAPLLAVATLGLSVASAVAGQQAKEADYAAKSAAWQQNVLNAQTAARDEQNQIVNNTFQEQAKHVQKRHVTALEGAQKRATAEVSAASSGVDGISVDNILDDLTGRTLENQTYQDMNYSYVAADVQLKLKQTDTRLEGRINSMERPIEPADTSILEIGQAGVKAFGSLGLGG